MKKLLTITCLLVTLALNGCRNRTEILPEEDYISFVRNIITDAYSESPDPTLFTSAFDLQAFAERIISQGDIPEKQRDGLLGFLEEYFQPGRRLISRIDEGADFQLVRFNMENDTAHLLFRIYNGTVTF